MGTESNIKAQIKRIVYSRFPTAKVYQYGSRIRGTAHKESDWDLLILLNEKEITSNIEDENIIPFV